MLDQDRDAVAVRVEGRLQLPIAHPCQRSFGQLLELAELLDHVRKVEARQTVFARPHRVPPAGPSADIVRRTAIIIVPAR